MSIDPKKYDVMVSDAPWDRLVFKAEHWLLSAGSSDMARLRGFLRVKAWRECDSAPARLHAIKATLKLPARALRDSSRAIDRYGSCVPRDCGVSRRRQLTQLWWLSVRHGIDPSVYYAFQLYRPGQLRRAPSFFQGYEDDQFFRLLNLRTAREEAELLMDKARFELWLTEQGFPTVQTIMEFSGGALVRSSLPDGRLPRRDLFSKPNDSSQGKGTHRWRFDGRGWTGDDGFRGEKELIAELAELSRTGAVLLQEQLRNHPAIVKLAPGALSTVRVLTLRGDDDAVSVVLAVAKIPTGTAPTDHMRLGGVAAAVELSTGRLRPAVAKSNETFVTRCDRHPDTGILFEGFQLPHWESVKQLAVRVHEALGPIVCVGWDIAILESGPIIIEGNDNPGHTSSQLPTGIAMGETPVVPVLLRRLRESFSSRRRERMGRGAGSVAPAMTP